MKRLLLILALIAAPGCHTLAPQPPPGTYTTAVQQTYDADQGIKALTALSQTAINLNAPAASPHLSDADLAIVGNIVLPAGALLDAWGNGATTLSAVQTGLNDAKLGPTASIVRAAISAAITKYGATASPLQAASALISSLATNLSTSGNAALKITIAAVAAGFAAAGY
jgi:hypothetical protein